MNITKHHINKPMLYKLHFIILTLLITFAGSNFAYSAGSSQKLLTREWKFDGFNGTFDRQSIQRGFQIYQEVCSACHALDYLSYRNLADVGFPEGEIKSIAGEALMIDGPNDDGEMFERPGLPSDKFVKPFPNEKAARAANNGAYPPDLSLIVKARPDGANYLYSLLNGYMEAPQDAKLPDGMYFNIFYPGYQIAMPPQLMEDGVEYQDGTKASIEQQAYDIVNFLQWAAEPEMEQRKSMGLKVILFLIFATIFFYAAKRKIWSDVH